jgi:hypothetical protein
MNSLLIHGCYDLETLETLKELKIKKFSFDLRPRSFNLVTYKDFSKLLAKLSTQQVFVTFENDKKETVLSYLSLLRNEPFTLTLIFRDCRPSSYYQEINYPFYWMFTPEGDWQSILTLPNIKGVLLPLKWQGLYQKLPELWNLIEKESLDVYLHADNFEQSLFVNVGVEIKMSVDLTHEIESGYRVVDQEKLRKMKIWRRFNENTARQ